MPRKFLAPIAALLLTTAAAPAQEWKPAKGPLMTKWAEDVRPDKGPPLPEYPRPQFVRKQLAEPQRRLAIRLRQGRRRRPGRQGSRQDHPRALPGRVGPVRRHEAGRARLVSPDVHASPKGWAGQRMLLHFGAVDWEATVYVNGKKVGSHRGGYDPFTFDITDALGKQEKQEFIVGVYDPTDKGPQPRGKQVSRPGGIYYTPTTGIWQTVWLEPVPAAHVDESEDRPRRGRGQGPRHRRGERHGRCTVRLTAHARGQGGRGRQRGEARRGRRPWTWARATSGRRIRPRCTT